MPDNRFGGASVGDLVRWDSRGELQFETPRRVRWVSDDGAWLVVEGSGMGIRMGEVTVESAGSTPPPMFVLSEARNGSDRLEKGFSEWLRAKFGPDKMVTIKFKGEGEIGPKEIEKMIRNPGGAEGRAGRLSEPQRRPRCLLRKCAALLRRELGGSRRAPLQAALALPLGLRVRAASAFSPDATSTMNLASWLASRGLLSLTVMRRLASDSQTTRPFPWRRGPQPQ